MEFQVAVINNFGGFYHTWVYFNEARRQGAAINLPCVNHSRYKTSIHGKKVFIGLIHLSNLHQKIALKIVAEREQNGLYSGLEDFILRVQPEKEQLVLLVRAGAFRFTGKRKSELLWEAHFLQKNEKNIPKGPFLIQWESKKFILPQLEYNSLEDAYDEIELFGFPVTLSWFDMLQTTFRGEVMASQLTTNVGKTVRMVGVLVTIKYVKTVKNERMYFATFIDNEGELFDTVHFPDSLRKYSFKGHGVYLLLGKVADEFGYAFVVVKKNGEIAREARSEKNVRRKLNERKTRWLIFYNFKILWGNDN